MRWPRFLFVLLLATSAEADGGGYMLGAGIEADADDGLRGSVLGGIELSEATWLSAGLSASSVELASGRNSNTAYADIEIDHHFDPVGIAFGVAYWGDPDLLDSVDLRGSLYYRNDKFSIGGDFEYRDFNFIVPPSDFFAGREFAFDANGIGARARYRFTDAFSVSASAMQYDYSVDFRPDENRDAIRLITISRLSLLNNLIDSRARLGFAFARGESRWELDLSTWEGALDRSRTKSLTVRYLRPISGKADIELGLGHDDSELYGELTFFSLFFYFYSI